MGYPTKYFCFSKSIAFKIIKLSDSLPNLRTSQLYMMTKMRKGFQGKFQKHHFKKKIKNFLYFKDNTALSKDKITKGKRQ